METQSNIGGPKFPTIQDQELQKRFRGATTWERSITEVFSFYNYVGRVAPCKAGGNSWITDADGGRIARPFLRDFDLDMMLRF
jgi:hypothetical protein